MSEAKKLNNSICTRSLRMSKESDYYKPIEIAFENLFRQKGSLYSEITANGQPSNRIKEQIHDSRNIIFSFLRDARPDITGFSVGQYSKKFFVIEVKNEEIKLDHIYQTRKYIDLFDAYFGFLVSTKEIPAEIKKITEMDYRILDIGQYRCFSLCEYDEEHKTILN